MIILHKPTSPVTSEEAEPFEAFLYNGSHLPQVALLYKYFP